MSYTDNQILEEYNNLRVNLETARRTYKDKFAKLQADIQAKLNPKYYEQLGIVVEELTAEHWLPSLYAKDFDKQAYDKEREETNNFMQRLHDFKEELKNKAAEEMGLNSNGVV